MHVLYLTSEWPTKEHYWAAPFIVRQVKYLKKAGIEVDVFPYRGRKQIGRYMEIYKKIRRRIEHGNYDLIHGQFGQSGLFVCGQKKIPYVITFQGSDLQGLYTKWGIYHPVSIPFRLAMQYVAFRAAEVVVVSRHMKHFLWRKDVHVIPGGVDLETFRPLEKSAARESLKLDSECRLIIFVGGRRNSVKRFQLADAAVRAVQKKLEVDFRVLENVEPEAIPVFMNAADVLLLTSKHEGSPNVIKEAMACNLPIVTLDVGDVRERLRNVDNSIVVDSEKPEIIAENLIKILLKGQRSNGWEAAQELNEELLAKKQIEVYKKALSGNQPG